MNERFSPALIAIATLGIALIILAFALRPSPQAPGMGQATEIQYACEKGKSIDAKLYTGTSTPVAQPGQPPQPSGAAEVKLSDGRSLTLHQTISADGVRYSDGNPSVPGAETFVFWTKGKGALVLEHNTDQTYLGCLEVPKDPGGLPDVFVGQGFLIRYPSGYASSPYRYQELGPGKDISGVKFTIPASTSSGTNLGSDTYLSVEEIPRAQACTANLFLDSSAPKAQEMNDQGTTYSVASTTGAAAGNRYEETVYAIPGTNPCVAVRYFVHYGVIENYPSGKVREFDESALLSQFDAMRRTLVLP